MWWVMTLARMGLKINVKGQGQGLELGLSIDCMALIVHFCCHVVSCALARRGVQHGAAEVCSRNSDFAT